MKTLIWNWISSKGLPRKVRDALFLTTMTLINAAIGYLLWLVVGSRFLPDSIEWILCFVGYTAFFPGFFMSILYLFKYE